MTAAVSTAKVCATNLKTYPSAKSVLILQASGVKVGTIGSGTCEEVCVARDPVCGSDARTYYNFCHLMFAINRGEQVTARHAGHCGMGAEIVGPPEQNLRRNNNIKDPLVWMPTPLKEALQKSTVKRNDSISHLNETNIKPNISLDAEIVFGDGNNKSYTMVIKDNKLEYVNSTNVQEKARDNRDTALRRKNPVKPKRAKKNKLDRKKPKHEPSSDEIKKEKNTNIKAVDDDKIKDAKITKQIGRQGEWIDDAVLEKVKLEIKFNVPKKVYSDVTNILEKLQK